MLTNINRSVLLLTALAVLTLSVLVYRPGHVGFWWQTLFDWMHVPVFGLVSLCLLALAPSRWPRHRRFIGAFLGAVAVGVCTEFLQSFLNRSPSAGDVIADGTGALSFLLLAASIRAKGGWRAVSLAIAVALLAWSLSPLKAATDSIHARDSRFPAIFGGNIDAESAFVTTLGLISQTLWSDERGQIYTEFRFIAETGRRFEIRDIANDWRDYSTLRLDIENLGETELALTIRIHDEAHRRGSQPHNDRFNKVLRIAPGPSALDIPLRDIYGAPNSRNMDLSAIDGLILFSSSTADDGKFALYGIRLH